MTDKEVAELAYQKGIDIAIEFNGFMIDDRVGILAHRPAPIQINYLAYPGTMGADFYDYIIADRSVIPDAQKSNYSENIIFMPDSYMPQDNTRRISNKPVSRTGCGLPEHGFVFCCFNNSFKISPQEFDIWMRLLNEIEGSVLWLLRTNEWSESNLRNEADKRGVDSNRLVFANKLPLEEHLGRLRLADLFLDTFNFNAHTTASDALWAGVPVVTKIGKSFAARVAGSLLTAIELPELITKTEREYQALALSLASNPKTLTSIKKKLAEKKNSASLFDTERYTKNLERAYVQAYQRYADGLPPAEFKVL
jgi:predicted O-linked N-acetylglucosamine transferase (SPINDLY family)